MHQFALHAGGGFRAQKREPSTALSAAAWRGAAATDGRMDASIMDAAAARSH